ncbi:hypothetical protein [Luteolibacter sp. LG18]|uniref:hypothetical protein n=1 Tax=Luteolibacter sp. LG18 TaxID=2819286 RepID=UPI002B31A5D2|nr:hypothetical protein llg_28350 [Luteolibacter sp. LG18]
MDTVIVCFTTRQRGLPHLERLQRSNPGKRIMVFEGRDAKPGLDRYRAWSNCDKMILGWWQETGRHLEFDRVVFLEWDVVCDADVDEVFPAEGDLIAKEIVYPGQKWNWWCYRWKLPRRFRKVRCGVIPLAVMAVSRRCLDTMFADPEVLRLYDKHIFCELRFPTAARACGFEPQPCPALEHVFWDKIDGDATRPGIWHPVKAALPVPVPAGG